jgi:hypothetical protein
MRHCVLFVFKDDQIHEVSVEGKSAKYHADDNEPKIVVGVQDKINND